jgi:TetR/AcrR family transcriptional regulator, cholesterol catabolism regulator
VPRVRDEARFSAQRQNILEHAARVFSVKGFHITTMDDVAAAVGNTKAALYYYFPNKEEILFQICEETMDAIMADTSSLIEDDSLTYSERIRQILVQLLQTMDNSLDAFTVFLQEPSWHDHPHAAAVRAKQRQYTTYIEKVISGGIESGELRPLPVRVTALGLLGMCNWSYRWMRSERISPEEIAEGYFDFISSGLLARQDITT